MQTLRTPGPTLYPVGVPANVAAGHVLQVLALHPQWGASHGALVGPAKVLRVTRHQVVTCNHVGNVGRYWRATGRATGGAGHYALGSHYALGTL